MTEASVPIGRAASLLGVSVPTIRRWDRIGKIVVIFRTIVVHGELESSLVTYYSETVNKDS